MWPEQQPIENLNVDVEKRVVKVLLTRQDEFEWSLPEEVSSWPRLLRITAYCMIFCGKLSRQTRFSRIFQVPNESSFTTAIRIVRTFWIDSVQNTHFKEEIAALKSGKPISPSSKLRNLTPFLDEENLLRVGGRLHHSPFSFDEKHPLILPKHRISDLVVEQAHSRCLHGGTQLTLRTIRLQFWILGARNLVKAHIHQCVVCTRFRDTTITQIMGDLPKERVIPARPFIHSGVDYAGPFSILPIATRGQRSYKAYIALFVCLATKAIHLELVNEYSTNGFLAAFKRFAFRSGLPSVMYSDNGTNFQGAERELTRAFKALSRDPNLRAHLASDGISWKIPPSAPHFGGLWEAGVKSVKHHLRRTVGSHTLSMEEFNTLLYQIESCINSRPISPLNDDPDDLTSLTPGHFLTGRPLNSVPEESVLNLSESRLDRWQRVRLIYERFWKIWSTDYLHTLQQRSKWQQSCKNLQVGKLVFVRNELLPPSKWELGRILKLYPDTKERIRVVDVKTISGIYKRPIVRLCRLPECAAREKIPI